jgi:hypothetical protein
MMLKITLITGSGLAFLLSHQVFRKGLYGVYIYVHGVLWSLEVIL